MTVKPHLVCEELCEDFSVSTKLIERDYLFKRIEEIKCLTTLKVAPILIDEMNIFGYSCVQIQKDSKKNKCTAWFEEKVKGV